MIYKHKFTNGQILTDNEYNETFVFFDRIDGYRAQENPGKIRPATDEEIQEFKLKEA